LITLLYWLVGAGLLAIGLVIGYTYGRAKLFKDALEMSQWIEKSKEVP